MKSSTLDFPHNARTVFTAVRHVVETCDRFSHICCNEDNFVVTASHGMRLIPLGEDVRIRVVATGAESTKVIIESSAKLFINVFASNKENVQSLSDFIANGVWRLLSVDDGRDRSVIRIVAPDIKMGRV
ncbi:MAG: hypothetical protein HUK03_09455 [Bacteroidaceae bacterium]|nr:hypothetical protein [Bacteroidaceae bacterium]